MLRVICCCVLAIGAGLPILMGADVDSDVSTRETYVGLPVVLRITVNNALEHETPEMPEVDGLKIEPAGPPSRSTRTTWINGRRTQRSTVTYPFLVTPLREGSFTVPPVKVVADGLATITKAVRIVATKSQTGDLMFVEIEGSEREIYVGEAIDLTLRIWVRPYRSEEFRVALDEQDMWYCLSDQTAWGPFQERIEELAQQRRRPAGKRVLREDSNGDEREYFLYEIETTIYPDRPSTIDGQDVRVIMNYPEELGRARSPFDMFGDDDFFSGSIFDDPLLRRSFGSRITVTKSRPIVAEAVIDPIHVRPVPSQGRPGDYVGAVGQYTISATATPQRVQVGEPITLSLAIGGTGSMDVVRAPPLTLQQNLVRDFKVSDEALAGVVSGSNKVFTTTIRPLRDQVTAIPPIEYTYFDPDREQFITAKSEPIPIEVEKADVLALDAIVGGGGSGAGSRSSRPSSREASSHQSPPRLYGGADVLKSVTPPSWSAPSRLAGILVPPALFLFILAFKFRSFPAALVSARRHFLRALNRADSTSDIADAMERFLMQRFRLAPGRLCRDQTIGALRAAGRYDLAIRVERLYRTEPTGSTTRDLEASKQEAIAIADEIGSGRLRQAANWTPEALRSTTASLLLCVPLTLASCGAVDAASVTLSDHQQQVLLQEGVAAYESGMENPDQVEAADSFRQAIDKFQLLVDSGIHNDRLYFNLAEASRQAGQLGRAIANYRRALRLVPDHPIYFQRLQQTEKLAGVVTAENETSVVATLKRINDAALRWISPYALWIGFVVAWFVFWGVLSARVLRRASAWKVIAALSFVFAVGCAASYLLRTSEFKTEPRAVLVSASIPLRQGDGESFAELTTINNGEGRQVKLLEQRANWLHVVIDNGQEGWISADDGIVL